MTKYCVLKSVTLRTNVVYGVMLCSTRTPFNGSKRSKCSCFHLLLTYSDFSRRLQFSVNTETYIDDFNSIDKDSDGSLSYNELIQWIKNKAKTDPGYKIFVSNPQVVAVAHKNAARQGGGGFDKIISITEFRILLVQLFATSVLWSHFYNADAWEEAEDVGNKQLNFEEFKLACSTLCSTHAREQISEEQIRQDFVTLDTNNSDSIGFVEVRTGGQRLTVASQGLISCC
jgi:Ca2+-binding EF-hand superfamily protein